MLIAAICASMSLATSAEPSLERSLPLEPAKALERFVLDDDLTIELVAAEPEAIDPIAIRFDEQGKLWVVEMRDYPTGPAPGQPFASRIRVLEDRDGDGRFETAQDFAEELAFPTGLQPWRGGAIVTLAGEIVWLHDSDGDGRADVRQTWFRGFAEENSQLRANHPRWGLDNRVYVANGLRGGAIVDLRGGDAKDAAAEPLALGNRDLAFDPRGGAASPVAGMSQFGMTFDNFGRRFLCTNRNPLIHMVIDERYAVRNALFALPSLVQDVAVADAASRVFPLSRAWTTSTLHAHQFTAACGATIFRGDALPERFRDGGFTCEPTGNVVHFETLTPTGATFTGKSPYADREFLATPDEWFRPVAMEVGPDGALYIVDMYRAVIEHPDWMPEELRTRLDLRDGEDRGRIYRIRSRASSSRPTAANLADDSDFELVPLLAHTNSWQRETAQRLIVERGSDNQELLAALEEIATNGPSAAAKTHAIWTLAGLDKLRLETIERALADNEARVREQGVLLSERWLLDDNCDSRKLQNSIQKLAGDLDARLRFQVALTLGAMPFDEPVMRTLARIAVLGADDPWTRRAVATALPAEQSGVMLTLLMETVLARPDEEIGRFAPLIAEFAELVGAGRDPRAVASAMDRLQRTNAGDAQLPNNRRVRWGGIDGLQRGAARRGSALLEVVARNRLADVGFHDVIKQLEPDWIGAALDKTEPLETRHLAIRLMRLAEDPNAFSCLLTVIQGRHDQELRIAAIESLAAQGNPRSASFLLDQLATETPTVRRALIDALSAKPDWTAKLLDAIESKQFDVAEIGPGFAAQLMASRDPEIKRRATALFQSQASDRAAIRQRYADVFALTPDPAAGRTLFEKNCATCHRIGDLGVDVGPDIADSRTKTPEQLLTDILEPNRAIDGSYVGYLVQTNEGHSLNGILASETASAITLRQAENKVVSLLRSDIAEIRATGLSLMPEGWDKSLPPQAMADLIAFIKHWRYLDGRTPLAEPAGAK